MLGLVGSLWVDQAAAELIEYNGIYYEIQTIDRNNLDLQTASASDFVDTDSESEPSWWGDSTFATNLAVNLGDKSIAFVTGFSEIGDGAISYSYDFGSTTESLVDFESKDYPRLAVEIAAPRPVPEIDGAALSSGLLALFALALGGLGFQRNRDSHPAKP